MASSRERANKTNPYSTLRRWAKDPVNVAFLLSPVLLYLSLNAVAIQEKWLMWHVAPKVVKITLIGNSGAGGTGFFLDTQKGTKLITNAHICEALPGKAGWVYLSGETEPRMVKVEKISEKSDMCIMSGVYGYSGLRMGAKAEPGDHLEVIGHPLLDPTTVAHGYLLGNVITTLPTSIPINKCVEGGYQKLPQDYGFFKVDVCVRLFNSYRTTIQIYPGNSGSPVLNVWGHVVGIVFASDTMTWKGRYIGIEEIEDFISSY